MRYFNGLLRKWQERATRQRAHDRYNEMRLLSLDPDGVGWAMDPIDPNKGFVAGQPVTLTQVWGYTFDELEELYKRLKLQVKAAYPDLSLARSMLLEVEAHYAGKLMVDTELVAKLKPQGFSAVQYLSTKVEMDGDVIELRITGSNNDDCYRFFIYDHPEAHDLDYVVMFDPWDDSGVWCRPAKHEVAMQPDM